jgi:hypothetical protein
MDANSTESYVKYGFLGTSLKRLHESIIAVYEYKTSIFVILVKSLDL